MGQVFSKLPKPFSKNNVLDACSELAVSTNSDSSNRSCKEDLKTCSELELTSPDSSSSDDEYYLGTEIFRYKN